MGFSDLMTDVISIYKRDGKKIDKVNASVQRGGIYIGDASKLLIEPGDVAYRQMSNGGDEYFQIVDPGFHEAALGIPATYQMQVRKVSTAEAKQMLFDAKNENQREASNVVVTLDDRIYGLCEALGYGRVKSDMEQHNGMRDIGGPPECREAAWRWLRMKEEQQAAAKSSTPAHMTHIATSRLDELRAIQSTDFDFTKLIRLCEEINIAFAQGCNYGTGMLTRAVLDHVPPLFNQKSFAEVANNHPGGRSFKETMQHLENATRKIGDGMLHTQIRKKEVLPTPQQVNCAPQLDLLLAEIIRISK